MSHYRFPLAVVFMCGFIHSSYACMPEDYVLARSPERIKKRFDSVDTVLIARLIRSRKITIKSPLVDSGMAAEMDTFVVTHVFKGGYKKGERFALTTELAGCGISAINDPPSVFRFGSGGPRAAMKDWLLYMNSHEPAQIRNSEMSMPLGTVSADLPILERLSRKH